MGNTPLQRRDIYDLIHRLLDALEADNADAAARELETPSERELRENAEIDAIRRKVFND